MTLGGRVWYDPLVLKLGSVALSGFFTYEVCRKLDPTHLKVSIYWSNYNQFPYLYAFLQIKGTYLVIYGRWRTFAITLVLVIIGAYSSYILGCHTITWYIEAILIIVSTSVFLNYYYNCVRTEPPGIVSLHAI